MPLILALAFLVTAIVYAAIGFGGGSTYSALLSLNGTDYRILPVITLACNVIVVSGGIWRFSREGILPLRRLAPFLAASIPAALIGGRLPVAEIVFVGLLGAALLLSGLRLLVQAKEDLTGPGETDISLPLALGTGGAIGLLSGIAGIGGGIFLAPLLYRMKWGQPRTIAAACSLFILANSLSGMGGQILKLQAGPLMSSAAAYWPLLLSVLIGGQIGSWLAAQGLSQFWIKRMTSVLILYVALRLLWRWAGLAGLSGG